ncbi:helix-turn-helix domain-containing protein [Pararhizobium sp. BT-229]|uniref:helix-turn-helix domain-containing protein n=1 Tax=Pararhizobium sp. BT-229 TaxID=2986923 RepID=UPI0021F760A7|nr:helix-turn-helix domain-containing protein [Pararhizobium sp. BT-229]MCV9966536.1 helix-turn-helix domain-containing protein [Pararhizobium sp. BT-229]
MLFTNDVLLRIAKGDVTLAFRRWRKPTVRAGGTLRTSIGVLSIDAMDACVQDDLTVEDAVRAGYPSLKALLAAIDTQRPGILYRIAFHTAGADPRQALRIDAELNQADRDDLRQRLAGFDARSDRSWAFQTLRLIASRDGITAGEIAETVGFEKTAIKQKIRKLKELGLTESLQSGYRISPRGKAFLAGI